MRHKINKYDIALVLFIIAVNVLILIYGSINTVDKGQKIAYVYSDNKLVGKYTLTEDYKTEFKVEGNTGYNIIQVEDGEIWIHDATCPDKICLSQGKIGKDGELIVCLPNKLMVQVEDSTVTKDDLDIIVK